MVANFTLNPYNCVQTNDSYEMEIILEILQERIPVINVLANEFELDFKQWFDYQSKTRTNLNA